MSEPSRSATIVAFRGPDHLAWLRTIARCCAESVGMDSQQTDDVALAVTEACSNAIKHGSPNDVNDHLIVSLQAMDGSLNAEVSDFGGDSSIPGSTEGPEPGFGLRLIKRICDDVSYAKTATGLTLRLTKHACVAPAAPVA